ncbi:MAG: hypothetical protein JXQ75_05020 [Phycisphaerae bacterium]|nr:hypothetical protein [Phycisphaerae bacterium]
MAEPALRLDQHSVPHQWHNHLPTWILQDAEYLRLRPQLRQTLQAIADACDAPAADGSLLGAFGGAELIQRIGCSRGTFFRHLKRLEAAGFVVTICRGGVVFRRTIANTYAIPGSPDALAHRRVTRRQVQMLRDEDGHYRPRVLRPGDQATLWRTEGPKEGQGVVSKRDGGSVSLTLPQCQTETLPSPRPSPSEKDHGASHAIRCVRGRRLRGVTLEDLQDLERLRRLFLEAEKLGLVSHCEADGIRFVAMAEHALRLGRKPAALFASNVNQGRWLVITEEDEQRALKRIRAAWGVPQRQRTALEEVMEPEYAFE